MTGKRMVSLVMCSQVPVKKLMVQKLEKKSPILYTSVNYERNNRIAYFALSV